MRRLAADGTLAKPRPVVIIQSDACETTDTVIVCPLTTFGAERDDARLVKCRFAIT